MASTKKEVDSNSDDVANANILDLHSSNSNLVNIKEEMQNSNGISIGPVEAGIYRDIKSKGTLCWPLIDAEDPHDAVYIASRLEKMGASGILIGGSSAIDQIQLAEIVKELKATIKIPVILFPGNVTGVAPRADAILFSSLLNSENPYFITQAQALGALAVKKYEIEPLPTAYIIVGEGTAAWFVGRARAIPFHKPELAVMYCLAAQFFGMRFVYLEAGSGAAQHISPKMVAAVRKNYSGTLIVGGGIRDADAASSIALAGADIIVVGTMIERDLDWQSKLETIIKSITKKKG